MPRMRLYLNFERALTAPETDALRDFVKRRGRREPLQHIIGTVSFCGLEMAVNRHALVPRPETELLAELGWQFLNKLSEEQVARATNLNNHSEIGDSYDSSLRALDLGTGTGCIAIALAVKCTNVRIAATDISADALALARENAARNGVAEQIEFLQGDGFAVFQPVERDTRVTESNTEFGNSWNSSPQRMEFDLIISNPPYIPTAEITSLQPEVRDFDPRAALDGGVDGLDFYRRFSAQAKPFLKPHGKIMFEFGDGQAESIRTIFENEKWIVEAVKADYSQRPRILIARL
jgi:release factor glutamine methyltransferase